MFIINARAPVHMRRALWAVLLLALAAAPAGAHKTHEFRRGCIASLPLVLDNATLYRQVCMSMNQSVTAWNYSADLASNGTHSNCVLVSYDAVVKSFDDFLIEVNFPMHFTKSVCLSDEVVVESATAEMCMFSLNYTSRNDVLDNHMNFKTQIEYGIPWFIEPFRYLIEDHILAKLRQNFQAWYDIICPQTAGIIIFDTPKNLHFSKVSHGVTDASHGITYEDLLAMLFR
jgi:hypothetical protein